MTLTQIKSAGLSKPIDLADGEKIRLGTGNDLQIEHTGGANSIQAAASQYLYIYADELRLNSKTGAEKFISMSVNGAVELYHNNIKKFETTSAGASVTGTLTTSSTINSGGHVKTGADFSGFYSGASDDLLVYHTGSNAEIINSTGNLILRPKSGETSIQAIPDGAVYLYYDNTLRLETRPNDVKVHGGLVCIDNVQIQLGNSGDLKLYHDGTNSYIDNTTTGILRIRGNNGAGVEIQPKGAQYGVTCIPDGATQLYHSGNLKVETRSNGCEVHGKLVLGNDDIPSGQISNYSLDVQGDGTNAYIDLGNPFPTFSAGQFPVARLKTVDSNKTLEIHSMWGGDNVLYKHIELAADKTKFFRGTSTNTEIAAFGHNGLTFNGDTAAANALDDYEEGTYTPTPNSGTASNNDGQYTKIGNFCCVTGSIDFDNNGTSGQMVQISLPFTAGSGRAGSGVIRYSNASIADTITIHVNGGHASMDWYQFGGSGFTYGEAGGNRYDFVITYRTV